MNTRKSMAQARIALKNKDLSGFQALLRTGFNFTEKLKPFPSAFSLAVESCDLPAMKSMLKHNKTKFLDYSQSESRLFKDIYSNIKIPINERRKMLKFFLQNGCEILTNNNMMIENIISDDDVKTFELFFNSSGNLFSKKSTVASIFYKALVKNQDSKIAEFLFPKLTKSDTDRLLVRGFYNYNKSVVKFLIESGVDKSCITKNDINVYEILMPSDDEGYQLFKLMVDAEANGEFKTSIANKTYAAYKGARQGAYKPVIDMIKLGVDVVGTNNSRDNLINAVATKLCYDDKHHEQFEMIENLIELGADPKFTDGYGNTLIHNLYNSDKKYIVKLTEIIQSLIELGVDINAQNSNGSTVAHYIAGSNYAESAKLLKHLIVKFGADMTIKNKQGDTPLMIACSRDCYYGVNKDLGFFDAIMHDTNVNINDIDSSGRTVLMMALNAENYETSEKILQHDIDLSIVNKYNNTAHDFLNRISKYKEYDKICDLMDRKIIEFPEEREVANSN